MSTLVTSGILLVGSTQIYCTNLSYDAGVQVQAKQSGGFFSAIGQNAMAVTPKISFTTSDSAVFDVLSVLGNALSTTTVKAYIQSLTNEGIRGTATTYTSGHGLILIDSVNLSKNSIGTVTGTIHGASADGTTAPFTIADGVTMPTAAPDANVFALGSCTINGTALSFLNSATFTMNNNVQSVISQGNIYPTFTNLMAQEPTVQISSNDVPTVRTLVTSKGLNLSAGGLVVNAYTTTSGVLTQTVSNTFTIVKGLATLGQESFSQGNIGTSNINVACAWNQTDSSPLVIS